MSSHLISPLASPGSFDVQCRSTARSSSAAVMPAPSSLTAISVLPPSRSTISILRAPASIAFSTSSLTAAAGRSMTSPAAMRLTTTGGSWRIFIGLFYAIAGSYRDEHRRASGAETDGAGADGAAQPDPARHRLYGRLDRDVRRGQRDRQMGAGDLPDRRGRVFPLAVRVSRGRGDDPAARRVSRYCARAAIASICSAGCRNSAR